MSFYIHLLTVLRTAGLQFEDEDEIKETFMKRFGEAGPSFGLEDHSGPPDYLLQLQYVAEMLDCRIRVSAEARPSQSSPSADPTHLSGSETVINPGGTSQGWARWSSSAHDEIEPSPRFTFGTVPSSITSMTVSGALLNELGWPDLLKALLKCRGNLIEALLALKEELIAAMVLDDPVDLARLDSIDQALIKEKARLLAASERTAEPRAERTPPTTSTNPLTSKNHTFYSRTPPVLKAAVVTPTTVQIRQDALASGPDTQALIAR